MIIYLNGALNTQDVVAGGGSTDPSAGGGSTDPSLVATAEDDFLGGTVTSGSIGALGLTLGGTGALATLQRAEQVNDANYPGVIELATQAVVGSGLSLSGMRQSIIQNQLFDATYIISPRVIDGDSAYAFGPQSNNQVPSPNFIGFLRNLTDTNWVAHTRIAGVSTTTDSGIVAVAETWYRLRMVRSATDVKFYINGTLVATHTTNIPTVAMYWNICLLTNAAGDGGSTIAWVDYMGIKITVTR